MWTASSGGAGAESLRTSSAFHNTLRRGRGSNVGLSPSGRGRTDVRRRRLHKVLRNTRDCTQLARAEDDGPRREPAAASLGPRWRCEAPRSSAGHGRDARRRPSRRGVLALVTPGWRQPAAMSYVGTDRAQARTGGAQPRRRRADGRHGALGPMVGGLAGERDRRKQLPERALRGHPGVLVAAPEGDDHVALDVGARALALAVRIPREGAGPLAAPTRAAGEAPDRGIGVDGSGVGADALVAHVMQSRPGQQPDAAARRSRGQQALHCCPRFALVGIGLAECGHRFLSCLGCRYAIS